MDPYISPQTIALLRANHSPQPTRGKVPPGLRIALGPNAEFCLWDAAQTEGYLTATSNAATLRALLTLERNSPGAVRALVTSAPPLDYSPPNASQETFRPVPLALNPDDLDHLDDHLDDLLSSLEPRQ